MNGRYQSKSSESLLARRSSSSNGEPGELMGSREVKVRMGKSWMARYSTQCPKNRKRRVPQYISRIHRGDASISIPRLLEIAYILGVSIPELFSDYKSMVIVGPGTLVCPHGGNKIRLTAEK